MFYVGRRSISHTCSATPALNSVAIFLSTARWCPTHFRAYMLPCVSKQTQLTWVLVFILSSCRSGLNFLRHNRFDWKKRNRMLEPQAMAGKVHCTLGACIVASVFCLYKMPAGCRLWYKTSSKHQILDYYNKGSFHKNLGMHFVNNEVTASLNLRSFTVKHYLNKLSETHP